jgi:hypothetical protein
MRFERWPEALVEVIEAARAAPFVWGVHDCSLFSADCVKAMTGEDRAEWRGKYKTARGAEKHIKRYGGMDAVAAIVFGGEAIPPLMAQRGDGVLLETEHGPCLGICLGADAVFVTLQDGLQFYPTARCSKAWRV